MLTHDSIGLGEDGPTHQPIEHLASLRLIPNMHVWRPCDTVETAVAWRAALERKDGPTVLALTRQDLPHVPRTTEQIAGVARGGYVLASGGAAPEDHVDRDRLRGAARASARPASSRRRVSPARVVSMPCCEVFDAQTEGLPRERAAGGRRAPRDRGRRDRRLVALRRRSAAACIGIDTFGASAPAKAVFEHFGFTVAAVAEHARRLL